MVLQTMDISQLLVDTVIDVPVMQVVQVSLVVHIPVVAQRHPDCSADHRDSQLLFNTVIDVPVVPVVQDIPVVV